MTGIVKLGDIVDINPRMPAALRQLPKDRPVPFLAMSAVSEAGIADYAERRSIGDVLKGYTYFQRGDVLLAKITPCFENGKAADVADLPDDFGFGSTEFHVLRPTEEIDGRYLFHAIRNRRFRAIGARNMTGTAGQKRVPADFLKSYRVPLPPLAEQHRIAALLDRADAVKRKRQASLRLLDKLLQSVFLEMFGDPVRNEKGWPTMPLHAVATVDRGKFTPRPRNDPRYYGGKHPFIQTGDIARAGGAVEAWAQTLNDLGARVSRAFPAGTIAMAIAANIGDSAIVNFDFYCPDSVVGITSTPDLMCTPYLADCLRWFKPTLMAAAPMTAQRNINLQVLRPLRIPVPPLALQKAFARATVHSVRLKGKIMAARGHSAALHGAIGSCYF